MKETEGRRSYGGGSGEGRRSKLVPFYPQKKKRKEKKKTKGGNKRKRAKTF
jgi:hypothetical protein